MTEPVTTHASIAFPARPEYLKLLRTIAASVAVGLDFSVERIDDLKMAVVEAASQLIDAGAPGRTLTVRVGLFLGALRVEVSSEGVDGAWPPEDFESSLTWRVLSTVARDISFGGAQGSAFIKLSVDRDGDHPALVEGSSGPETSA